jgi:FkbM family methyltransferase
MRTVFRDEDEHQLKLAFFAGARDGYFVEVGANDPIRGSQTLELERLGWKGVLIEPQPDLAQKFRGSRRAHIVAVACSSPANNRHMMTLHMAGPHSSLNDELAAAGVKSESSIQVPVRTLDEVLTDVNAPAPLDFVSIDVEGHELDVLKGMNLGRWQPRLILLEDHLTSLAAHRYVTRKGYRLVRRTGLNSWYVPRESLPRLGWGKWQLIRKYYFSHPFRLLRNWKRRLFSQLWPHVFGSRLSFSGAEAVACRP